MYVCVEDLVFACYGIVLFTPKKITKSSMYLYRPLSFALNESEKTLLKRYRTPIGEIPYSYCRVRTLQ